MPEAPHIRTCRRLIRQLESKEYFSAALATYNQKYTDIRSALIENGENADTANNRAYMMILSHLHDIMRSAQTTVEECIQARVASGEIHSADQARKSVAGNLFQQFFAYTLAKNVVCGNIEKPVTVSTSAANIVEQYAAIRVDDEVQKPDSDVIVYSENNEHSPIMVFSCKTSCRERAGQTYKWKLLCDLATCRCAHREGNPDCPATKYNLHYTPVKEIKMCFVTTDFYNELSNPQISAMFSFFDHSYVAKVASPANSIHPLQTVVDDINRIF